MPTDRFSEEPLMVGQTLPEQRRPNRLNLIAFFIFGLVNNVIYVIFLSAAEDILLKDRSIRKSTVLLADILPCLFVKFISPHCVRVVPYGVMVTGCVTMSLAALGLVGWMEPISLKFLGVILASASSGLGETCYLALTSYYHPSVVIAWSSGTGTAGIIGAVYYLFFSSVLRMSMHATLTIACVLPLMMAIAYIFFLRPYHEKIVVQETTTPSEPSQTPQGSPKSVNRPASPAATEDSFKKRIRMIRPLIYRYILPLFLVFYAEYMINQAVFFSLLFPLPETPFQHYRDHYVSYQALYQTGVFFSRSFGRMLPVRNLWIFAFLQCGMLLLLTLEALLGFIGSIYIIFVLVLIEGLLGGMAYVNTFCNISAEVDRSNLEFSMAFTGIADSSGIALAGFSCLLFEPFLCERNKYCRIVRGIS